MYITGGSLRTYIDKNAANNEYGGFNNAAFTESVNDAVITAQRKNAEGENVCKCIFDTSELGDGPYTVQVDGKTFYTGGRHAWAYVNEALSKDEGTQISVSRTQDNWIPNNEPNLVVINYTEASGGSSPAMVAFADNGTDFTVKSEQSCAVMLVKADGTVQTLKATASGDAYAYSAEGAAEGDRIAVALGKLTPSPVQEAVANVNDDSKITAADAVMIKAIALGKTKAEW